MQLMEEWSQGIIPCSGDGDGGNDDSGDGDGSDGDCGDGGDSSGDGGDGSNLKKGSDKRVYSTRKMFVTCGAI